MDRREWLTRTAWLSAAPLAAGVLPTGIPAPARAAESGIATVPALADGSVTAAIARYVHAARYEDLPEAVRHEGVRTFLNWLGVAVGGSRHETIDKAVAALSPFFGKPQAGLLGRRERCDASHAALVNGISSHIFDYDDTHLKTIIHPGGPVASALLAFAELHPVSGREFLNALVLGVEIECRIGNAVYPSHYDLGWHITGTCGMFGSAVAVGKLLGLDEQKLAWALGIAASQPVGLKVQFGSMTKSFHIGRAAQNGLMAALLAAQGFTADNAALEGKDGFAQAASRAVRWGEVTDGLGTRYEAALNTYKPFACGIVTQPGIDAAIQLRNEFALQPAQVAAIELHANPLVLSLTGKSEPTSGLEGKFSIHHCLAVGLVHGAAGERQFQDAVVREPDVVRLRRLVTVRTDAAVPAQQCDLTVRLTDGRVLTRHIDDAIGSQKKPLTDAALEVKAVDLMTGILPVARIRALMERAWRLDQQANLSLLAKLGQVG